MRSLSTLWQAINSRFGHLLDRLDPDHEDTASLDDRSWGRLPALSVVITCGLLLVAWGDRGARAEAGWATTFFWLGLLVIFVPAAVRLISTEASRRERIGLVLVVGMSLYLVKVFHSPLYFTFFDELLHQRTMDDMLQSGHLFEENPLLPVGPGYPGLENATDALIRLGGLDIYSAGIILIGVVRVILVLGLYLFYEEIGQSPRLAGIATLFYISNPHFFLFDSMYSYESLALALTIVVLYTATRRTLSPGESHLALTAVILLGIGAIVTTHHVTTHVLIGYLALWTVTFLFCCPGGQGQQNPVWTMILAIVITLAWILNVASLTIDYLVPVIADALTDFSNIFLRGESPRQLFEGSSGQTAPLWEQFTGYLAALLIVSGVPPGVLFVWRRHRTEAVLLALAGGALAYPITQALRFTESGIDIAARFSPFLYVPLSLILAFASRALWPSEPRQWKRFTALLAAMIVIFMGGVVVSFPRWGRMPGPYLPSADMRSVEPEGISAAKWLRDFVGPNNRIIADRTNSMLMVAYGRQRTVTASYDGVDVPTIFLAPVVDREILEDLQAGKIEYLIIDHRLSAELPLLGFYYDGSELQNYPHTTPIPVSVLEKFDTEERVNRIFDSGSITIYDVRALSDAE